MVDEELRMEDGPCKGTSDGICDANRGSNGKVTLIPLIALIFYEVSGGPFGVEDSVKAGGGPLLALLGFLVFPLIWSVPEALITAELSTIFPENGGYVAWISAAFGPFWGFQEGFWKWFSGVMDNALYPVLFLDYLKNSVPAFNMATVRIPFLLFITFCLTYLNYRGLAIVGFGAVGLAAFSLLPFLVMGALSIPSLKPRRWLVIDTSKVNWSGYFNSMFWNLNYWDKASTLVGEIENPIKTFPKALFGAVILVMLSYLIPLLAGTGALEISATEWSDGYFAQVGMLIGGAWLRSWIQVAAALSNIGLFEAEMSSDAFQLLGMSEMGMLPEIFSYREIVTEKLKRTFRRSKYGTPVFSILCSATGVVFLSWMSFQEIIEFLNFLYSVGMLLEFAAFIKLRINRPDLHRPYKVPCGTTGAIIICLPPVLLLILVMCLASLKTFIVSTAVIILGFVLYPTMEYVKNQKWLMFDSTVLPTSQVHEAAPAVCEGKEVTDEASVSLLSDPHYAKKELHNVDTTLEGVLKLE